MTPADSDVSQEVLTFTGGSIEAAAAELAGCALKASLAGAGTVPQVTVVTFTSVAAERVNSSRTDCTEEMTSL